MTTPFVRNPGVPLRLDWVAETHVNRPALERRAATHATRRSIKKGEQLAWLCRAITCIDLTALSGDDTETNVKRMCMKARNPLRPDFVERLGLGKRQLTTGAVCVYPNRIKDCVEVRASVRVRACERARDRGVLFFVLFFFAGSQRHKCADRLGGCWCDETVVVVDCLYVIIVLSLLLLASLRVRRRCWSSCVANGR